MHWKHHIPHNSWRWEELRKYMKSRWLDVRISENVRDITRIILNQDSPEVRAAKGHYIYQPTGKTHYVWEKLVRIDERKYMVLLWEYLTIKHGRVTLEAKHIFERGDVNEIRTFIDRLSDEESKKIGKL